MPPSAFWAPKPKRLTVTLPANVFSALEARSTTEGRSLSNLTAFLVERALEDAKQSQAKP